MKLFPKIPDDPASHTILQGALVLLAVATLMFLIAIMDPPPSPPCVEGSGWRVVTDERGVGL